MRNRRAIVKSVLIHNGESGHVMWRMQFRPGETIRAVITVNRRGFCWAESFFFGTKMLTGPSVLQT